MYVSPSGTVRAPRRLGKQPSCLSNEVYKVFNGVCARSLHARTTRKIRVCSTRARVLKGEKLFKALENRERFAVSSARGDQTEKSEEFVGLELCAGRSANRR